MTRQEEDDLLEQATAIRHRREYERQLKMLKEVATTDPSAPVLIQIGATHGRATRSMYVALSAGAVVDWLVEQHGS